MKNENNCCDQCEQDFERNIDRIVDQVDGYSQKEHRDKRNEVEDAFDGRESREGASEGRECYGRGEHNELDKRYEQHGYTEQREIGGQYERGEHHRHGEQSRNGESYRQPEHRGQNEWGKQPEHHERREQPERRGHGVQNEWDEHREQPAEHRR